MVQISLNDLLNGILLGVAGNAAYDAAKLMLRTVWQAFTRRNLDDLYLDAFDSAAKELGLSIGPRYSISAGIDRSYLRNQLVQNIVLSDATYEKLQDEHLLQLLT